MNFKISLYEFCGKASDALRSQHNRVIEAMASAQTAMQIEQHSDHPDQGRALSGWREVEEQIKGMEATCRALRAAIRKEAEREYQNPVPLLIGQISDRVAPRRLLRAAPDAIEGDFEESEKVA